MSLKRISNCLVERPDVRERGWLGQSVRTRLVRFTNGQWILVICRSRAASGAAEKVSVKERQEAEASSYAAGHSLEPADNTVSAGTGEEGTW